MTVVSECMDQEVHVGSDCMYICMYVCMYVLGNVL